MNPSSEKDAPPYSAFPEPNNADHHRAGGTILSSNEIAQLRDLLKILEQNRTVTSNNHHAPQDGMILLRPTYSRDNVSLDSDYPGFGESTHAWAVFADNPQKRAGVLDRVVGSIVIFFQLFTYWMFASEAIEDYASGQVVVTTSHASCAEAGEVLDENSIFQCEAGSTNNFDAFVAFVMLGIFLAGDFIQAFKVVCMAEFGNPLIFALLATLEVFMAFISASIAVSYNLYIGEVTDAVEVGVGLLFIRELSQRAYAAIRDGKAKQYGTFFVVLGTLITVGMLMDPFCEFLFASYNLDGRRLTNGARNFFQD